MRRFNRHNKGLNLTELLVVMVIIGLLATIAVPVYISRLEDARVRTAKAEEREIAMAEEQCAILHGFYVPFQVLDDRGPQNLGNANEDRIDNENSGNIFLINPLIVPTTQIGNQLNLNNSSSNPRIREMRDHWAGPFLTPQRVYVFDPNQPNSLATNTLDFPMDPWGQPYRFYSPLGIIGTNAQTLDTASLTVQFSDGVLTRNDPRNLERYAVVSYGRDNTPDATGSALTNRDDVVYLFGTAGVESNFGLR